MIRDANKPILGYSDITACLSAWTEEGVPSIHACMSRAFEDLSEESMDAEKKIITGQIPSYKCGGSEYDIQGEAEGILDEAEGIIFGEWVDRPVECDTYNGNSRG